MKLYAVVKDSISGKLSLIEEECIAEETPTPAQLAQHFNYNTAISSSYVCGVNSCDETKVVEMLKKREEKPYFSHYEIEVREKAFAFYDTLRRVKEKYDVVAYSHCKIGWQSHEWIFNEDIKFDIRTNFGYGWSSYFSSTFSYKDITLAPYSFYTKYQNSTFASVVNCTYCYDLKYSEWKQAMNDAIEFYNAIISQNTHYIYNWLKKQLNEMVSDLESFVNKTSFSFVNCGENRNCISGKTFVDGDDFWILKSQKIAGALLFLEHLSVLPAQICTDSYKERIKNLCTRFLPLLESKIVSTDDMVRYYDNEIERLSTEDYLLYKKLYNKFHYRMNLKNKRILVRMLHIYGSKISKDELIERINEAQKIKKAVDEIKSKQSVCKSLLSSLKEPAKDIEKYFQKIVPQSKVA